MSKRNHISAVALRTSPSGPLEWAILAEPKRPHTYTSLFHYYTSSAATSLPALFTPSGRRAWPHADTHSHTHAHAHAHDGQKLLVQLHIGDPAGEKVNERVGTALLHLLPPNADAAGATDAGAKTPEPVHAHDDADDSDADANAAAHLDWLVAAIAALQAATPVVLAQEFDVEAFKHIALGALRRRLDTGSSTGTGIDGASADTDTEPLLELDHHGHAFKRAGTDIAERVSKVRAKDQEYEHHEIRAREREAERQAKEREWREKEEKKRKEGETEGEGSRKSGWFGGWWVSYGPQEDMVREHRARAHRHRNSWERQDDAYGGLM